MMKTPLERFIAVMAPHECHICSTENFMLCQSCEDTTVGTLESRCYICNKLTLQHTTCSSCRSRSALRRVWWLGSYEKTLKELIFLMKYQRRRGYADAFGVMISDWLPFLPPDTLVMPVPTASSRVRMRGFDQSIRIATAFASARNLRYSNPITRITQVDQIGKNRTERLKQMQSSFTLASRQSLPGSSILLVDDVLTTGATLEAAARLLRTNGARHVDAAVIARHLPS